jgi:hypothetical protein
MHVRQRMKATAILASVVALFSLLAEAQEANPGRAIVSVIAGESSGHGAMVSPAEAVAFVRGTLGRSASVTLWGAMKHNGVVISSSEADRYRMPAEAVCYTRVAPRAGVVRVRLAGEASVTISYVGDGGVLTGALRLLDATGKVRPAQVEGKVLVVDFGELPLLAVGGPAGPGEVILDHAGRLAGFPLPLTDGRMAAIPIPRGCGRVP